MQKQLQKSGLPTLKIKENDLDMITGGAAVVKNIDKNWLETNRTQQCNCKKFEPHTQGISLNICDNCIHARSQDDNIRATYCSVQ